MAAGNMEDVMKRELLKAFRGIKSPQDLNRSILYGIMRTCEELLKDPRGEVKNERND